MKFNHQKVTARIAELEQIIKANEISVENGATPVLDDNDIAIEDIVTCGSCGLSWNDALMTGRTPAPSARCPYEYIHPEIAELRRLKIQLHNWIITEATARRWSADGPLSQPPQP